LGADVGYEPVVEIIVDNLSTIGIQAEADPRDAETYFSEMADGDCQMCRLGWYADYPTYDNFMYDLFHGDSLDGNNYGANINEEFDQLVDDAKQSTDAAEAAELYNQAEDILLNQDIGVVPINWFLGDQVYNDDKISKFPMTNQGLILYERIELAS